ncbi:hypothetical protein BV11031_03800 [Bacillus vallismortis]|nr:hypothetical protein BV11031_03800 [Bacillus vallismortis]
MSFVHPSLKDLLRTKAFRVYFPSFLKKMQDSAREMEDFRQTTPNRNMYCSIRCHPTFCIASQTRFENVTNKQE